MKLRKYIILLLGLVLYTVFITGISKIAFTNRAQSTQKLGNAPTSAIYKLGNVLTTVEKYFTKEYHFIKNNTSNNGFTYHQDIESNLKLLTSYTPDHQNSIIELHNIKDNCLLKRWKVDTKGFVSDKLNNPYDLPKVPGLYLNHPLMTQDSSVIINGSYLLIKILKDNTIAWQNNTLSFHHSIEQDHEGNIYTCATPFVSKDVPFMNTPKETYDRILQDDHIVKINPTNGEIVFQKSVMNLLIENGFESLIYKSGNFSYDPIHINDIQPALSDGNYWKKGDLLISIRSICAVFLYRPSENKVTWIKQGPWINQHDADFLDKNTISVFGNDVVFDGINMPSSGAKSVLPSGYTFPNKTSQVYLYHFENDSISTPYAKVMSNQHVKTAFEGRSEILPNGDLFIEETGSGRILLTDTISKKVEFAVRIDEDYTARLFWSRIMY